MTHSSKQNHIDKDNLWKEFTKEIRPLKKRNLPISNIEQPDTQIQTDYIKELTSTRQTSKQANKQHRLSHNITPKHTNQVSITSHNDTSQLYKTYSTNSKNYYIDDLDARTRMRLGRGQMPIGATLDLHGYTRIQAHDALHSFIISQYQQNIRCVCIITGKSTGILQQNTRQWLLGNTLRPYILGYHVALRKDGGEGALYTLLRRNRT